MNILDDHPFARQLARYGVPTLMLVFYVTASLHFDYTPDSTFATLNALNNSNVDSLWSALLALAKLFRLDILLAAKVFCLLFSCFSILFSYLIANEILNDYVLAFCTALAVSMQAWLIQLAPTGSSLSCALFLSLATIFFLLRNEYIIAALFAGLSSLVAWQAAGLVFIVILDGYVNSVDKHRALKVIASVGLVFVAVVLPWMLYTLYVGRLIVPAMEDVSIASIFSLQISFEILLLVGTMFVGVALLLMRDRQALNSHIAVLLWIAIASFSHRLMFVLALPFIIVYIFFSVQKFLESFGKRNLAYIIAVAIATLILAYNQLFALPLTKHSMKMAILQADELKTIALWIRAHVGDDQTVGMPLQHHGLIQFYSEGKVGDENSGFLVSDAKNIDDCEPVFNPAEGNVGLLGSSSRYKVWRRY